MTTSFLNIYDIDGRVNTASTPCAHFVWRGTSGLISPSSPCPPRGEPMPAGRGFSPSLLMGATERPPTLAGAALGALVDRSPKLQPTGRTKQRV